MTFTPHIDNLTAKASVTLYALKPLKAHELQDKMLWEVTQATLIAHVTYDSSSWNGFTKHDETNLQD